MRIFDKAKQFIEIQTVKGIMRAIPHISDERLLSFAREMIETIPYPDGREFVSRLLTLGRQALLNASPNCRDRGTENFFINQVIRGMKLRRDYEEKTGVWPPYVLVISPTMRCNLNCYGCYAGSYSKKDDLPFEVFDRVLREAKEIGIFFITISGGEPFISEDVLAMFERHNDMFFQVYTNGTLIDEAMADRLCQLGNVMPCISVEGFEKETEERRGKGVYQKILRAMRALKEKGVIFGFSATATRQNNEFIVSDDFVKFYSDLGCFIGWYFQYIPIGREPNLDLVPTPQQRIYRLYRLRELRRKYPIVLADFWNDGPLIGGCIAGGRYYLHINNKGDVEPCVFAHFAVDNIKEKSLHDAIQSDFFKEIRARQPFNQNHLRPCMIIDNPHMLREIVAKCGARPTHPGADNIVTTIAPQIDENARKYGELADEEWRKNFLPYFQCAVAQPNEATVKGE